MFFSGLYIYIYTCSAPESSIWRFWEGLWPKICVYVYIFICVYIYTYIMHIYIYIYIYHALWCSARKWETSGHFPCFRCAFCSTQSCTLGGRAIGCHWNELSSNRSTYSMQGTDALRNTVPGIRDLQWWLLFIMVIYSIWMIWIIYIYDTITGCWLLLTPLKNDGVSSSVGMMNFPIYGNIKNVPNHQPVLSNPLASI